MTGGHSRSYSKKMIVVRDKSETAARKVRLFFMHKYSKRQDFFRPHIAPGASQGGLSDHLISPNIRRISQ